MFRYSIFILFNLLFTHILFAQDYNWAYSAGGIGNDVGTAITTDADGNIYLTGNISGSAYFGNHYVSGTIFEVFLAKYDTAGNALWAKNYGGLRNEKGNALAVTDNAIYVCGYFEDTATFGNTRLISKGSTDIFVMKTDLNGNEIWTKQAGGSNEDIAYGLAVDGNENVYVSGTYKKEMTVANTILSTTNNFSESFLFSLDKNGDFRWAKSSKGNDNNAAFSVAWNQNNAVSVCGFFGKSFSFESTQVNSQTTSYDAYTASFDTDGNLRWLSPIGSAAEDQGMAVSCDPAGNSYITGYMGGTIDFDDYTLPFNGWNDILIAKINDAGQYVWVRQAGGQKLDMGTSITLDENDNVYVAGMFEKEIKFSNITLHDPDRAVFLASYDKNGNFRFAQEGGDVQTDAALGVAVKNNIAFITGYYLYKCKFGDYALPYADFFNIFIASYNIPNVLAVRDFSSSEIALYPNPAQDVLNLTINEDAELTITNTQGEQLKKQFLPSAHHSLDISELSDGIYFLHLKNKDGHISLNKFVKQ